MNQGKGTGDNPGKAESGIRVLANPELYPAVLSLFEGAPRGRILDVPAGHGAFAQALLARGSEDIHCLDINADSFALRDPRVSFRQHDVINPMPFPDSYFDCVFSLEGIEHFRGIEFKLFQSSSGYRKT